MATIGGRQVRDVAKERKAALTAGKKPAGAGLGNDAKNIKIRQKAEEIPDAYTPRKRK